MNPLQEAVFIGGKQNGVRAIVDTMQRSIVVHYPPTIWDEPDTVYAPNTIKVDTYNLHLMLSGQFIAVHSSLTLNEALELLIKRYPKKRKPRDQYSQKEMTRQINKMIAQISKNVGLPSSFNYNYTP